MPEQDIIESIHALVPNAQVDIRPDGGWLFAPEIDIVEAARRMVQSEATLSTITARAIPGDETELVYHYHKGSLALNIKTRTRGNQAASITPVCQAAGWIEREIHDLYAVMFTGHPNLARLILPPELPVGLFRGDRSPRPGGAAAAPSHPVE
jgi:NADH:ubiquinone oxidoreductase subunit C